MNVLTFTYNHCRFCLNVFASPGKITENLYGLWPLKVPARSEVNTGGHALLTSSLFSKLPRTLRRIWNQSRKHLINWVIWQTGKACRTWHLSETICAFVELQIRHFTFRRPPMLWLHPKEHQHAISGPAGISRDVSYTLKTYSMYLNFSEQITP